MARPKKYDSSATFQSIRAASELTGLSYYYIRNGCKAGTIPHIRVSLTGEGGDYRVNMPLFLEQLRRDSMNG